MRRKPPDPLMIEAQMRRGFAVHFAALHKDLVRWLDAHPAYEVPWTFKCLITIRRGRAHSDAVLVCGDKVSIDNPEPWAMHQAPAGLFTKVQVRKHKAKAAMQTPTPKRRTKKERWSRD